MRRRQTWLCWLAVWRRIKRQNVATQLMRESAEFGGLVTMKLLSDQIQCKTFPLPLNEAHLFWQREELKPAQRDVSLPNWRLLPVAQHNTANNTGGHHKVGSVLSVKQHCDTTVLSHVAWLGQKEKREQPLRNTDGAERRYPEGWGNTEKTFCRTSLLNNTEKHDGTGWRF